MPINIVEYCNVDACILVVIDSIIIYTTLFYHWYQNPSVYYVLVFISYT